MNLFVYIFIICISFIIGFLLAKLSNKNISYGEIVIDHKTDHFNLRLNSDDLQNTNLSKIELDVFHKN